MKRLLLGLLIFSAIFAQNSKIIVEIDPRIEILEIVEYLARDSSSNQLSQIYSSDNKYAKSIDDKFGKYRNHKAIQEFKEMRKSCDKKDAIRKIILHLTNPPDLKIQYPIDNIIAEFSDTSQSFDKEIQNWLVDLRDFAQKTEFMKFYESNGKLYKKISSPIADILSKDDICGRLENYFGESKSSYTVILSPIMTSGFGEQIDGDKLYAVVGPTEIRDNVPYFCIQRTPHFVSEQFAYYFVKPIVDANWNKFEKSSRLLEPLNSYLPLFDSWKYAVYYHLEKSAVCAIEEDKFHKELDILSNIKFGFQYLLEIQDIIEIGYLPHRDKYPKYSDFVSKIAERLDEISRMPEKDFKDRLSARITSKTTDLWALAERECKKLTYSDITALIAMDMQSYPRWAEYTFQCFLDTRGENNEYYWVVKYQLGKIEYIRGEYGAAEKIFNEYLKAQPNGEMAAGAFWRLGQINEKQGDLKQAEQLYRHAIKLDSNLLQAKQSLNSLLQKMNGKK
ncbi:DUF4932 domain-containing protein [bacterium]|nr:DUF4932 domain-containing protein [bacterium]